MLQPFVPAAPADSSEAARIVSRAGTRVTRRAGATTLARSFLRHDLQHLADVGRGAVVGDVERTVRPDHETRRVAQPSLRVNDRPRAARRDADDRARPAKE